MNDSDLSKIRKKRGIVSPDSEILKFFKYIYIIITKVATYKIHK